MNAACEILFVSLTPVACASPSETEDELLVPVVDDAPPVVVPAFAPATAPIEVLPPELPDGARGGADVGDGVLLGRVRR